MNRVACIAAAAAAAALVVGCSVSKASEDDDGASSTPTNITAGGTSADTVLKSTLFLSGGCTATKVGSRHLLVAARCVSGKSGFAAGKSVRFTVASASDNALVVEAADAGAPANDGGAAKDADPNSFVVASLEIPDAFAAHCKDDVCGFEMLDASDAPDVALLVASADIANVPSLPIDLDAVGAGDPLLVVNTGCESFDESGRADAQVTRSTAAPATAVNHAGSAYKTAPQMVTRLGGSYVVSPGAGWSADAPHVCAADIGAPVVRGNVAAVAGVMSNLTTFQSTRRVPVTILHTRVDEKSRFKIGAWLANLGVSTIHSCSESMGGCVKRGWDGGAPPPPATTGDDDPDAAPLARDAGADASPGEPPGTHDVPVITGEDDPGTGEEPSDFDAAVPNKKSKKKDEAAGCSVGRPGPGTTGPWAAFGIAVGLVAVARRRRTNVR